jgi:phosphoribosylanthranilate isomerase
VISSTGIDLVQLHGNESPEMIDHIWAPVIKVAHVSTFAVDVGEEEGKEAEAERATAAAEATEAVAVALRYTASAFSGKAVCLLFDAQLPGTQGECV